MNDGIKELALIIEHIKNKEIDLAVAEYAHYAKAPESIAQDYIKKLEIKILKGSVDIGKIPENEIKSFNKKLSSEDEELYYEEQKKFNQKAIAFFMIFVGLAIYFIIYMLTPSKIQEVGYFKDDSRNRIYAYSFKQGVKFDKIVAHAKKVQGTGGKLKACYYFIEGSDMPTADLTFSFNLIMANNIIDKYASEIKFAYLKSPFGEETIANCYETPKHNLCNP